jgi:hypothetical protein
MKGHGAKFGRKMEEAVAALLTHRNHEEAAKAVGIGTATLLRWQKQPEFEAAYREAKRESYKQSIARMHHMTSAAVSTLGKIMVDPAVPPSTRVRAADSILDHAAKAIEIEDIDSRVAALEQAAESHETNTMKLKRRLDRLEEQFVSESMTLTMPDGTTALLRGPDDYVSGLLGVTFSPERATPEQTRDLALIKRSSASQQPGGSPMVDLIRALLLSPVEEI